MQSDKNLSKYLSLILRHAPEQIGLNLDSEGWGNVDFIVGKVVGLTRERLEKIVAEDNKQRYSFNKDRTMIRANQGHSVAVDLKLEPVEPPVWLFHGTAARNVKNIVTHGLKKMSRQHVHLSADEETAYKVGARHGNPVVFHIPAKVMHMQGHKFYLSKNGVWLAESIPSEYLQKIVYSI
jgi:putative RNA 2'-phosphotransferase